MEGTARSADRNQKLHVSAPLFAALPSTIYGGANEVQRDIVARHVLQLAAQAKEEPMTAANPDAFAKTRAAAQEAHLRELWRKAWPEGLAPDCHYPHGEVPLTEYLRAWARVQPDQPAVQFYGHELSYAELDRQSDRFAALLHEHGIGEGDRVSVMMPNCPQFHIVFFGIMKRGAIYAPLSPMSTAHEARHQLGDSGAAAIVVMDSLMPVLRDVRDGLALRLVFVTSYEEVLPPTPSLPVPEMLRAPRVACTDAIDLLPAMAAVRTAPPAVVPSLDAPAALNYTGGTTGMPKGCIHTPARHALHGGDQPAPWCSAGSPTTSCLNFVPVFWIAGEDIGLIFPMFAGATVVLLARWDAVAS